MNIDNFNSKDNKAYLHFREKNTKLVIFFSSYTTQINRFDFYKVGTKILKNGYDVLFCADYSESWYLNGILGLGTTVEETCVNIKAIIEEYQETTTVGSSMGGYAALLYGTMLNTNIISFGSDIVLQASKSQSSKLLHIEVKEKYKDVKTFFDDSYTSKAFLFVGDLDHSDLYYTSFIDSHKNENINVYIVRNCFHSVPIFLNEISILESFLLELLETKKTPTFYFLNNYNNLGLNCNNVDIIINNIDNNYEEDDKEQTYLELFYKGVKLWNKKLYEKSVVFFEKALIINPNNIQTMLFLAINYRELKFYDKSLLVFKAIEHTTLIPFPRMYFEFALLYFRMNKNIDAIYYFMNSIKFNYNIKQCHKLVKELNIKEFKDY